MRLDHGSCVACRDDRPQSIAVVGFVGKHGAAGLAVEQGRRLGDVADLSGRDDEAERTAERIGQHMDFGGQSTSGTPQRLIFGPPFPFAACWWARTIVLSIIKYWLSRSAVSAANTRSQTPAWHQRLALMDALPLAVALRQIAPVRA